MKLIINLGQIKINLKSNLTWNKINVLIQVEAKPVKKCFFTSFIQQS